MNFHMNLMIGKYHKIFRRVIQPVSIDMMGFFFSDKTSPEFIFRNNYMFKNISFAIRSGVIWLENFLITLFNNIRLTICQSITFTRTISSSLSFGNKFKATERTLETKARPWKLVFILVFHRAKIKITNCRRMLMKRFMTSCTNDIWQTMFSAFNESLKSFWGKFLSFLPFSITKKIAKMIFSKSRTRENNNFPPTIRTGFFDIHAPIINNNCLFVKYVYHFELGDA